MERGSSTHYLTFSCFSLITSVNFPPPSSNSSSNTHMGSFSANLSGWERIFRPAIFEIAEPQLPEPIMQTWGGLGVVVEEVDMVCR